MQGIIFVLIRPPGRLLSSEVFRPLWRSLVTSCFVVLAASQLAGCDHQPAEAIFTTPEGSMRLALECASTPEDRSRGLMFRASLQEDQGMLFVFPRETWPSFWMKHTFLSLDILFLSEDGLILDMAERLPPCAVDPCPVYQPRMPSRYALEVVGGFAARNKIQTGDRVELKLSADPSCSIRQDK